MTPYSERCVIFPAKTKSKDLCIDIKIESDIRLSDEVDIQTIHEAYQYLSKKFVDDVTLNTLTNKTAKNLTIENIKSNTIRRNSCKAKIHFAENSEIVGETLKSNSTTLSSEKQADLNYKTTSNIKREERRGSTSVGSRIGSRRGSNVSMTGNGNELAVPKITSNNPSESR